MKKPKTVLKPTEEAPRRLLPADLGFPKKVAAAIRNVPLSVAQKKPPDELVRALKKTLREVGNDIVTDHAQIFSPLRKRFQEEFPGGSLADAFEHGNKVLSDITCNNPTFSATVPVVLNRFDTDKPEVIASGVLVRIVNRTFLLTAAHVTDRQEDGILLIPGEQGFMPINGGFSSMRLPTFGRLDDKLDVAYFWLDEACVANLHSTCAILERPDVSLEAEPVRRTDYSFAGFPWRKSHVSRGEIATTFQTCTGIEARLSEYEALGLTGSLNVAIRFHRRRTCHHRTGRVGTAPLPDGMSGGGIYAWTEEALKTLPVRLPLIGIANDYIPERSLLIGTRLHVFVGCIFHNHPDLAAMATG